MKMIKKIENQIEYPREEKMSKENKKLLIDID